MHFAEACILKKSVFASQAFDRLGGTLGRKRMTLSY
jgi:hypothetical protein